MTGLVNLATQRAAFFDRHAAVAAAAIRLRFWLSLRRLQLASLLRILGRLLLGITPIVATIASFATTIVALFLTLLAPFVTVATASLAIALTGKRAGADDRQHQRQACPTDQVVTHFFLSGRCDRRTRMAGWTLYVTKCRLLHLLPECVCRKVCNTL